MSELTHFHADIKSILAQARSQARSAVNAAMVEAYWLIGQRIVQEEQQGQHKAQYGARLMEELSIGGFRQGIFLRQPIQLPPVLPCLS